jgi:hypothetical protein
MTAILIPLGLDDRESLVNLLNALPHGFSHQARAQGYWIAEHHAHGSEDLRPDATVEITFDSR